MVLRHVCTDYPRVRWHTCQLVHRLTKKQGSNCFNFLSSWTIPPSYKVSVTTGPSLSRISSFSRLLISAWKNMLRRCDVAISCKTVQISCWSGSVTRWKITSCAIDLAFVDVLILRLNNRVRMLHCMRQLDVFSRLKTNKQTTVWNNNSLHLSQQALCYSLITIMHWNETGASAHTKVRFPPPPRLLVLLESFDIWECHSIWHLRWGCGNRL